MMFIQDIYGNRLNVALMESFIKGKPIGYGEGSVYRVTMASGARHEVSPEEFAKVPVDTP